MEFIKQEDTSLLVVDMQERLMSAMPEDISTNNVKNMQILIEAAKILNMPITVTEQYPKGLGPTIAEIKETLGEGVSPIEKLVFSCARSSDFKSELESLNRKSVLICGIETHICVLQTAMDLVNDGYKVYVPVDTVISQNKLDWKAGVNLLQQSGAILGTLQTFLFQLLERAGTDEFKQISRLLR